MKDQDALEEEWLVSDYMDNGELGIVSKSNKLIVFASQKCPLWVLARIVADHNNQLARNEEAKP